MVAEQVDRIVANYVAGTLPTPMRVLVESHLELKPESRVMADVLEAMEEYAAALRRRQMLDDVGDDLAPEYCIPVLLDELREDADAEVESSRDRVAEVSVSWDCSRTSWEGAEGADLSEDPLYDEKDVPKARKRREARREKLARQLLEIFLKDDDEKSNE